MKRPVYALLVHGGMTFKNDRDYLRYLRTKTISLEPRVAWSGEYLDKKLGKSCVVVRPRMPLPENAKYRDWKILFERYLPLLDKNFILIGNSLGGIFLAKYLSEHKLRHKALGVYLVCAPFDNSDSIEDVVGGFTLGRNLSLLQNNTKNLHFFFSADDKVVPPSHAEKYKKKLPDAHVTVFKSKNGHFLVEAFPEIVKAIQKDV